MVHRRRSASIMPDSLPSCFGEHEALHFQMSGTEQNSVMCLYQISMGGSSRPVSVTWCRTFLGQGFSISIDDKSNQCMCTINIKPWLFWRKQGSKTLSVDGRKMEVYWNLSSAKYVCGPEPQQGFYVAVLCDQEVVLFLGDMQKEALKKLKLKLNPSPAQMATTLLSKKEHLFGRKTYSTKAQFGEKGLTRDIAIECHNEDPRGPQLCVKVDKQAVVQVQHLMWKFRGNQTILVDDLQVEVFWDVHNWLFDSSHRHAVFMFQTCASSSDKPWLKELGCSPSLFQWSSFKDKDTKWFTDTSCASALQWPQSHSFKETANGRISSFSLLLYAWRNQ